MGFLNDFLSATPQRDTLLSNGSYNKKIWIDQEIIREGDLNTLEDIAYKNRQSVINDESEILALTSRVSTVEEIANTQTATIEVLENEVRQITEEAKSNYITINGSKDGYIQDIELFGNTVQSSTDLKDIQSVGTLREDGLYEINLISCGKNLFDKNRTIKAKGVVANNGSIIDNPDFYCSLPIKVKKSKYIKSTNSSYAIYNSKGVFVSGGYSEIIDVPADGFLIINIPLANIDTFQLEEGSVLTAYESYQEVKSKIILPCQLQKVGNVYDRLFRRIDGVWCIEKNIDEVALNGNENWKTAVDTNGQINTLRFYNSDVNITKNPIMCNRFNYSNGYSMIRDYDTESVGINDTVTLENRSVQLRILKTKLPTQDVAGLKTWLSQNPLLIKYQLATPQIIDLPLNTQIQLKSFLENTNIFTDGITTNPTIKCTVAKSLGATVQALNVNNNILSDRIEKIETLQEGNNLEISTDKSYVVVDNTKNGYIDDLKIKGKTLVNLCSNKLITQDASIGSGYRDCTLDATYIEVIKPNTMYTVILSVYENTLDVEYEVNYGGLTGLVNGVSLKSVSNVPLGFIGTHMKTVISKEDVVNQKFIIRPRLTPTHKAGIIKYRCVILEGDHTQNPPSNFEGLKSVGDDADNIEILSHGKNLFDKSQNSVLNAFISSSKTLTTTNNVELYAIKCSPNTTYTVSKKAGKYFRLASANTIPYVNMPLNNVVIEDASTSLQITTGNDHQYLLINVYDKASDTAPLDEILAGIQIETGTVATSYQPYQENKKQILYRTEDGHYKKPILRELPNGIKDVIEKHDDGKYYFHKRCEKRIFNGSEDISSTAIGAVSSAFIYTDPTVKNTTKNTETYLMCDRFPVKPQSQGNTNTEGSNALFAVFNRMPSTQGVYFYIPNSYLTSTTSAGFKEWLAKNPTTVIYQLAVEEIYECIDLDLDSYESKTSVVCNNSAVHPNISFKITSHIGNVISKMKNDITKNTQFRESLAESVTLYKESENGYLVAEDTKDGYINDLKIEGKTLINLATLKSGGFEFSSGSSKQIYTGLRRTITAGKYTIIVNITENTLDKGVNISLSTPSDGIQYPGMSFAQGVIGIQIKLLTVSTDVTNIRLYTDNTTTGKVSFDGIMVLEGDHTQNPPKYFEGLKSVGDGVDKLEVLSSNNGNLVNIEMFYEKVLTWAAGTENTTVGKWITNFIEVFPKTTLSRDKKCVLFLYDKDKTYLGNEYIGNKSSSIANINNYLVEPSVKYIRIQIDNADYKSMFLGMNQANKNIIYTQNKKQILYQTKEDNYEKPILKSAGSVSDTIEKHSDGKYYFHKRCNEIVLNGNSNIAYEKWESFVRFTYPLTDSKIIGEVICDRFSSGKGDIIGADYVRLGSNTLYIYSKDTSKTTEQFKLELTTQPLTVVYQLATEEVCKCVNLDLDSYEGETSVIFDDGAISPKISLKITSRLANTLQVLKDKVSYLEDRVINMFKAVLSGNVQTLAYELYPEDFKKQDILQEQTNENI